MSSSSSSLSLFADTDSLKKKIADIETIISGLNKRILESTDPASLGALDKIFQSNKEELKSLKKHKLFVKYRGQTTVVSYNKSKGVDSLKKTLKSIMGQTINFEHIEIFDTDQSSGLKMQIECIEEGDQIEIVYSTALRAKSASDWDERELKILNIKFQPVESIDEILQPFVNQHMLIAYEESEKAKQIKSILKELSPSTVLSYQTQVDSLKDRDRDADTIISTSSTSTSTTTTTTTDATATATATGTATATATATSPTVTLLHPLWKSCYLMNKYSNNEALVDKFLYVLLRELGFDDDYLCVIPQFSLPLTFGSAEKEAKADLTIMDITSYYRMAVIEDKSVDTRVLFNSEPQMIAEAIAAHQQNIKFKQSVEPSPKRPKVNTDTTHTTSSSSSTDTAANSECDPLLAMRLHGNRFHFYSVLISPSVLTSMQTMKAATEATFVSKYSYDNSHGFDFTIEAHRSIIIEALDKICYVLRKSGQESKRRESRTKV